jgi:hypothetical protein
MPSKVKITKTPGLPEVASFEYYETSCSGCSANVLSLGNYQPVVMAIVVWEDIQTSGNSYLLMVK